MTDLAASHHHDEVYDKTTFGFWVYLMTDCVLFGILFATYVVLHKNVFGGPSGQDLFDMDFALTETIILLVSSFTCGFTMLETHQNHKKKVVGWFAVTFLLGAAFIGMEVSEFAKFVHEGNSWERSAFLSSFFTLVGTHGLHISVGLLWMGVLMVQVWFRGLTPATLKRVTCLRLFWHFLDFVWIFIFTIVYLMGAIG